MSLIRGEGLVAHGLFGLTIGTNVLFSTPLAPPEGPPDLLFTCMTEEELPDTYRQAVPRDAASGRRGAVRAIRHAGLDVLRIHEVADYFVASDRITCRLLDLDLAHLVEVHFLGIVMSWWLERLGLAALHASSVEVSGRAVAFLSSNRGGKSGLAAAFMQQGHPLLTDDILAVESVGGQAVGRPGYPSMRMWPDEADHFLSAHQHLPRVVPWLEKRRIAVGPQGFGRFLGAPAHLACIYVPARREDADPRGDVDISPLTPASAVMALVTDSFARGLMQAMGNHADRLALLARLVEAVPVRCLSYPSGFEHLPRVREAILRDLEVMQLSA